MIARNLLDDLFDANHGNSNQQPAVSSQYNFITTIDCWLLAVKKLMPDLNGRASVGALLWRLRESGGVCDSRCCRFSLASFFLLSFGLLFRFLLLLVGFAQLRSLLLRLVGLLTIIGGLIGLAVHLVEFAQFQQQVGLVRPRLLVVWVEADGLIGELDTV